MIINYMEFLNTIQGYELKEYKIDDRIFFLKIINQTLTLDFKDNTGGKYWVAWIDYLTFSSFDINSGICLLKGDIAINLKHFYD